MTIPTGIHAKERRRGRELALQALYASEQTGVEGMQTLKTLPGWRLASPYAQEFAIMLLERLFRHANDIASAIRAVVKHWDIERVARVDNSIIRLATCELLYCPDIPVAVSINEAIEMAKKYSTEQSGRFVNGILDAIAMMESADVALETPASQTDSPHSR